MIYGHDKTIHHTTGVDVEIDRTGKVVSVWYRCMRLPFTQSVVDDRRAAEMREAYIVQEPLPILAIEFEDSEEE